MGHDGSNSNHENSGNTDVSSNYLHDLHEILLWKNFHHLELSGWYWALKLDRCRNLHCIFFRWEVLALRATSKIASSALLLVSQNLQVTIDCILMWQTGSPISKPYTYSIFNYISPLGSMSGFSSTITLGLIIGLTWCQCLLQYRELAAKANSAAANHHCRPPARLCDTKRNPDHSHISSL